MRNWLIPSLVNILLFIVFCWFLQDELFEATAIKGWIVQHEDRWAEQVKSLEARWVEETKQCQVDVGICQKLGAKLEEDLQTISWQLMPEANRWAQLESRVQRLEKE